jgi:hypothetical protein
LFDYPPAILSYDEAATADGPAARQRRVRAALDAAHAAAASGGVGSVHGRRLLEVPAAAAGGRFGPPPTAASAASAGMPQAQNSVMLQIAHVLRQNRMEGLLQYAPVAATLLALTGAGVGAAMTIPGAAARVAARTAAGGKRGAAPPHAAGPPAPPHAGLGSVHVDQPLHGGHAACFAGVNACVAPAAAPSVPFS